MSHMWLRASFGRQTPPEREKPLQPLVLKLHGYI